MTTIAFDGKTLSADSQITGAYLENGCYKIKRIGDKLCGGAGDFQSVLMFFNWIKDGEPEKKPDLDKDFEALIVCGNKVHWIGEKLIRIPTAKICAIGSGCQFAIAAMYCGKTSKEAVALAKKLDAGTGGKVRTLSLK